MCSSDLMHVFLYLDIYIHTHTYTAVFLYLDIYTHTPILECARGVGMRCATSRRGPFWMGLSCGGLCVAVYMYVCMIVPTSIHAHTLESMREHV